MFKGILVSDNVIISCPILKVSRNCNLQLVNVMFSLILSTTCSNCFLGHVYNPKTLKSLNYWHFGGKRLLLLTKNTPMKRSKKIGQGPPPSFGQNPNKQQLFFRETLGPTSAQNWHFWPNMDFFGPFDPVPDQKLFEQVTQVAFLLCGYQKVY